MNGPLVLEIAKIVGSVIGFAAGALVAYWKIREKRLAAEYKLSPNPTRCAEMIIRMEGLEGRLNKLEANNREDHRELFNQIGAVGKEVARICGRMNGSEM